ncbi:MAG: hypothetical protein WKF90_07995 [Pyrinomonadaceae bacterium]
MLLSILFILLITVGGFSLTYLLSKDESVLWRVCAGNVIGSTVFGLICFLAACFFGFTPLTISLSVLLSLFPLIIFYKNILRQNLLSDFSQAKENLAGAETKRIFGFVYYAFFLILFWLFFERAMLEATNGILTGASNNLGDLPFHLGAIFSFTEGNNFPPDNPSYAFAKFSYPFIADLITASFVKLGADVRDAMLIQNVTLAFSLLVVLERFTCKLTGSRLAGKIAPVLLFFSGGLGFLWFFKEYWEGTKGFFEFVGNLPRDYTIGEQFRWGNSLNTLFITQRSLLLGMPLTIIVLQKLWELFAAKKHSAETYTDGQDESNKIALSSFHFPLTTFLFAGLLAGTLPLVHAHSLFVLFVVSAFLFFLSLNKWREWIAFAVGVLIVAVPELVWVMTGSATHLTKFIDWHFGWDAQDTNVVWFWLKNTGIFIPLLILTFLLMLKSKDSTEENKKVKPLINADSRELRPVKDNKEIYHLPFTIRHLYFFLPFVFLFLLSNAIKLAPWEWDNIKVLIYWFVASIPFVAAVLAWLWNKNNLLKFVAAGCLLILILAGALDVVRVVSRAINNQVFDRDAIKVAEQIKQRTAPNSLFLNAPTFNSAVVLSGRRSLMRYVGHLSSYGIDYGERENDLKQIYAGGPATENLLNKYNIEYVLISPEETRTLQPNEGFFRKYPLIAEYGQYRVYQIKK